MENNAEKNNIFIYLLIVFLAIFFGTGVFLIMSSSKAKPTNQAGATTAAITKEGEMVVPTSVPTEGNLTLLADKEVVKNNNNFIVTMTANSGQKNIVGYDMVLYYDPASMEFVKAESLLPDFQIYPYKKDNYIVITAVKSLQSQSLSVFSGNKILSFTFTGKKIGKNNLSLRSSIGNEKTKLMTDKTETLNPKLSDLQIEIN